MINVFNSNINKRNKTRKKCDKTENRVAFTNYEFIREFKLPRVNMPACAFCKM